MNRTVALVVGGLIFLSVVSLAVIVPAVTPKASAMTLVLYDESGNKVYEVSSVPQFIGFGYTNVEGSPISKAIVTVTYTVSGAPISPDPAIPSVAVNGAGTVVTRLNTQTAGIVKTSTNSWSDTKAESTFTREWSLSDIVSPVDAAGKQYGWSVEFSCVLTATTMIDGNFRTSTKTLSISLSVKWVEAAFSIDGTISVV